MQNDKTPQPPRWADRLLQWYCRPELLEDLQGDLHEYFQRNLKSKGLWSARITYIIDVIKFIRPYTARLPKFSSPMNYPTFIQHYLKAAFRSIGRRKLFSGINILGMAVSMSVGLLLIAFISELKNFDRFHANFQRIYRVVNTFESSRYESEDYASTSILTGKRIEESVPGVEEVVTITRAFNKDLTYQGKTLPMKGLWASTDFFRLFSFDLISGNSATALQTPYSLVLTRSSAEKLFRSTDVVGKVVSIDEEPYTISALIEDPPRNSHLQFGMLASLITAEKKLSAEDLTRRRRWTNMWNNYVYLLLEENADLADVQAGLNRISEQENRKEESVKISISLQPMRELVVGQRLSNQVGYNLDRSFIWFLAVLAFVVILSACFNYANLSIARALRRSKEVGVRKVVGASKRQVFLQFIMESVLIAFVSLIFSYILFVWIRPQFLSIEPKFLERLTLYPLPKVYLYFAIMTAGVGLLAGFFPALFFSRIDPAMVIKDVSKLKLFKHLTIRRALITFQYVLSICFIIAATIGNRQYKYSLNFDLGFNTENVLNIDLKSNDPEVLKQELEQLPEVIEVSASMMTPSIGDIYSVVAKNPGTTDSTFINYNIIDENYLSLHDHQLIAGENFRPPSSKEQEEASVIVNEKTLEFFGLGAPVEAIGRELLVANKRMQIIGVVEDFHYSTLDDPIRSFVFRSNPKSLRILNLKIATADMAVTMDRLQAVWKKVDATHPFEAQFFDDSIQETYGEYTAMVKIISFLALLAIMIASFGLLGMVVFTTETRLKEISIRKIMGATESDLILLLSRGFLILLAMACLIAVPSTYYLFDQLLFAEIAFRAPLGLLELFPGVLMVMGIALLAISSQTIRVARANPVEALRNE